jgi:hypothetical protein
MVMKKLLMLAVALVVLTAASTALAGWAVVPARVHAYYPVGPVYTYPAPAVVAPAPVVAPGAVVAPRAVWYGRRAVVRPPRVYVRGQPVRNAIRVALP